MGHFNKSTAILPLQLIKKGSGWQKKVFCLWVAYLLLLCGIMITDTDGRVSTSWLQSRRFESRQMRFVVSLSMTLNILVLVQPRKTSQHN